MSIKIDTLNFSRTLLTRFTLVAAFAAVLAVFIYVSGNVGSFSSSALLTALKAGSMAGIAAAVFSAAGLVATLTAPAIGARFSGLFLPVLLIAGFLGLVLAIASSILLVLTGGLSF
jgi:hypothetical protein